MGFIISINNLKGGCGKTTTVQSLAAALTLKGNRCLVVDFDPHGNLSFASHAGCKEYNFTIYDLMKGTCSFDDVRMVTEYYDIITADFSLYDFRKDFYGEGQEYVLRNILDPIRNMYDYILIDTPTSYGILTINSLIACDYVIMPTEQSFYALQGLEQLYEVVKNIQGQFNKNLKILGLLRVKYSEKAKIDRFMLGLIDRFVKEYKIRLFDVSIHESQEVCISQGMGKSIIEFSPRNRISREYMKLADQIEWEFAKLEKSIV